MTAQSKFLVNTVIFGENGDGLQNVYKFPNGYGASVVRSNFSYGGKKGLWEIAVLDNDNNLCYSTSITSDVIGHLNDPQMDRILGMISRLNEHGWSDEIV
tara:strand:- start:30 stop:329 length:300 start_codon:yes stop_codon:yes gene_type:complete